MNNKHKRTILIAEDNDESRQMLCWFLKSLDYNVVEAKNGKEAIELARREKPHLILMDLNMPELDGITATKQIRQLDGMSDVPVLANSGYGKYGIDLFLHIHDMGSGFVGYITKPINLKELAEQIKTIFSENTKNSA